jgi:3-hydroxypropanoate dehydrogenase
MVRIVAAVLPPLGSTFVRTPARTLPAPLMNTSTDQLFTQARTQNAYLDRPLPDTLVQALYELLKWGPTSANCSPARFVFVRSAQAKAKLAACVLPANQAKVLSAPVTAIIGMDMAFYEQLPALFPHTDARAWFVGNTALIDSTALRNSSLQGAYLMMAARALGLGCAGTPWSRRHSPSCR